MCVLKFFFWQMSIFSFIVHVYSKQELILKWIYSLSSSYRWNHEEIFNCYYEDGLRMMYCIIWGDFHFSINTSLTKIPFFLNLIVDKVSQLPLKIFKINSHKWENSFLNENKFIWNGNYRNRIFLENKNSEKKMEFDFFKPFEHRK